MGYAIKRQPLSLGTVEATDLLRMNDYTDGLEKKVTASDLANYVLTGASEVGNVIEVYNITNPVYGGQVGGTWDDALNAILTEIGTNVDENAAAGVIYAPPSDDDYLFDDSYLIGDRSQIVFLGNGSSVNAENKKGASRLVYTGTDDYFIKSKESGSGLNEGRNFSVIGLDICHRSASFTGALLHLDEISNYIFNCRFGYEYFNDLTHRYTAKGIYVENAKQVLIDRCNFDRLTHGYYADEQVEQKVNFSIQRCDFNTCSEYAVLHEDTNTGQFLLWGNSFNPTRLVTGQGPVENGVKIVSNGYSIISNVWQSSQPEEIYSDIACEVIGRGVFEGNYVIGGSNTIGLKLAGGVASVSGNHIIAGLPLYAAAGDLTIKGGANYYTPPNPDSGENVAIADEGGSVASLTDSAAYFSANLVGQYVIVSGATNAGNNGTFQITTVTSQTEIRYTNASVVTESGAADYKLKSATAVRLGASGLTGSLTVDMGPDRIETNQTDVTDTFLNSYQIWNNSALQGEVKLPSAANDESDSGPSWSGLAHGLVFKSVSSGWKNLTSDYTLTPYDNGKTFTNYGATGTVTIDIPDNAQWNGFECYIIVAEAFEVSIEPQGSTTLYVGGGAKTDLYTSTKGNQVIIKCGPSGAQWFGNNYGGWSTTP